MKRKMYHSQLLKIKENFFLWVIVIFCDIYEDVEKQIMAADSYDHD